MVASNEYGTEDIQNELLSIMKIFHQFCLENGITYSLFGGSCIGAVRHHGFIPWDDDLDICMDRSNYNKLLSCFEKCDRLKIHMKLWTNRIQKNDTKAIRGYIPTIDVFVIDNAPDNSLLFKTKCLLLSMLQGMLKKVIHYERYKVSQRILLFLTHGLGKLFSENYLQKKYEKVAQIGNNRKTKYVHCPNDLFAVIRMKYPESKLSSIIPVKSEDTEFYMFEEYDPYLTVRYGDYMRLPPVESRKPMHV